MASFRMSPTSGTLPETRITSPIMLHLFTINDRSRHSRKYALPVESPWLVHLHATLRHLGKISLQNLESSQRLLFSQIVVVHSTGRHQLSRKTSREIRGNSWNLRMSFFSSLTCKFERKSFILFSRSSSVAYVVVILVAQSIRNSGINNYSFNEYRCNGISLVSGILLQCDRLCELFLMHDRSIRI